MAVARFLRPDAVARAAATPVLRVVQGATLRAWRRPGEPASRPPWGGAAASIALHAALIGVFLWQAAGSLPRSAAAVDVVFQQIANGPVESPSGTAPAKIEEAQPPADVAEAEAVPPADAPDRAEAETVAPSPVEQVAAVLTTPAPAPLATEPVAQVAAELPAEALPAPPPPRPVARKRPVEVAARVEPKAAPTETASEVARKPSPPPAAAAPAPGAAAESTAPAAVAAAVPTSQPQGDIPVIHDARFRQPPAPARYPPRAVDLSQEGTVIVRALVGPDGSADDIVVWRSSGYALLDAAALRAVRGWAFEPASVGGRRITAWVEVPVRFAIR
jgi:protein TonB